MQKTDASKNPKESLTIRIGLDSLAILTPEGNLDTLEMKSGISASANLREAFKTHPLLNGQAKHATVLVDATTMLIPEEEFNEEDCSLLFSHAFSGHESDLKGHYAISNLHAVALFAFEKDLQTVINDHFSTSSFIPVCAPLWQYLGQRPVLNRQRLYGYFHDGKLDLFCIAKNRFKFCNTFSATHAHDTLYYLLNAFSQLGLKADRDEISLIGSTPHKLWIANNLQTYVQRIIQEDAESLGLALLQQHPSLPADLAIIHQNNLP